MCVLVCTPCIRLAVSELLVALLPCILHVGRTGAAVACGTAVPCATACGSSGLRVVGYVPEVLKHAAVFALAGCCLGA